MKKIAKTKLFGTIAALALFVPGLALASLNPVLDGANIFQIANLSNSAEWGKTAEADSGETLTFMVHIHNKVVDTTAKDVRVQVTLPAQEVSSYTSRVTVSASNASTVSGTTQFTLTTLAKVEYITGSTRLYNHNNQLEQALPDGITSAGGIIVGDNKGCFENEKWVIFKAKVIKTETPPVIPPVTPPVTPPATPTPALPASGPAEATAGIIATMGIGGAGYMYRKSRAKLDGAIKKY